MDKGFKQITFLFHKRSHFIHGFKIRIWPPRQEGAGYFLLVGGAILAMTMGSRLSEITFDIHFEKAREDVPGAYNAVNCHFARYLRLKYPEVKYLNREDDMGLEGLRTAKLSYRPHHMVEKYWAYVREDIHED